MFKTTNENTIKSGHLIGSIQSLKVGHTIQVVGEIINIFDDTVHIRVGEKVLLFTKDARKTGERIEVGDMIEVNAEVRSVYGDTIHIKIKEKVLSIPLKAS
ncbi:hypothetical protein [Priestia aryabhattai]